MAPLRREALGPTFCLLLAEPCFSAEPSILLSVHWQARNVPSLLFPTIFWYFEHEGEVLGCWEQSQDRALPTSVFHLGPLVQPH